MADFSLCCITQQIQTTRKAVAKLNQLTIHVQVSITLYTKKTWTPSASHIFHAIISLNQTCHIHVRGWVNEIRSWTWPHIWPRLTYIYNQNKVSNIVYTLLTFKTHCASHISAVITFALLTLLTRGTNVQITNIQKRKGKIQLSVYPSDSPVKSRSYHHEKFKWSHLNNVREFANIMFWAQQC